MRKITADIIYTISGETLKDHVLCIDEDGTILKIDSMNQHNSSEVLQLRGALIPGFVNAHTHLELSFMKDKIRRGNGLSKFIVDLLSIRQVKEEIIQEAIMRADEEMHQNGIVAVGDIANTTNALRYKKESALFYYTFIETLGYAEERADEIFNEAVALIKLHKQADLQTSLAPHAPYSLSRRLWEHLSMYYSISPELTSIHMLESKEEINYCYDGSGAMKSILEYLKYPEETFTPYGLRSIRAVWPYMEHTSRILMVHNTFMTQNDFNFIGKQINKIWLCTCPKANLYIENKLPDYEVWKKNTSQICIGTDSLASNNTLSVWEELKTIHHYNPELEVQDLLKWGTLNGANALGINNRLGSIEKDKKPGIIQLEYNPAQQTLWDAQLHRII